jgi:dCMP deaminase
LKTPPRKTPERDAFYLGLAFWIAAKSKDPNTQCGALIVDSKNKSVGWGYNGPPKLIDDNEIDWSRPVKYPYIVHAEQNAIDNSHCDLAGCTLYVTALPCNKCMLEIVSHGITKVVWKPIRVDSSSMLANKEMIDLTYDIAEKAGVFIEEFAGSLDWMQERMKFMTENGLFDK